MHTIIYRERKRFLIYKYKHFILSYVQDLVTSIILCVQYTDREPYTHIL